MNYFAMVPIGRPSAHVWPTLRPDAAGRPVLPVWRYGANPARRGLTTDHLATTSFLTVAPGETALRFNGPPEVAEKYLFLLQAVAVRRFERISPRASDVPSTNVGSLAFHGTMQSVATWRKAARVSGGAYVFPLRLPPRCFSSHACPWFRSSLKLYRVPATELADIGFGSPCRINRIARLIWPLRWRTTRATSPAD